MLTGKELRNGIKVMMIKELMLDVTMDEIEDCQPLFGTGGLGLDSVDALQLVVALEKDYGLKLDDSDDSKKVMWCVETIARAVEKMGSGAAG